jgi:hypothetical protein
MTRTTLIVVLAAAAALAGCSKQGHTIIAGGDPADNADNTAATNTPVALPPAIVASKIYRCTDNKIVYVDWLADNKTANIRNEKNGNPTQVSAAEPGKPMSGPAGYSLSGSSSASSVKIAIPGHPSQSCNA